MTVTRSVSELRISSTYYSFRADLKHGAWYASWFPENADSTGGSTLNFAFCDVHLADGSTLDSQDAVRHLCDSSDIAKTTDEFGRSTTVTIHHVFNGGYDLRQRFQFFTNLPYFFVSEELHSTDPTSTNNMGVVVLSSTATDDPLKLGFGDAPNALTVPFDNDHYDRYTVSGAKRSYEVTAIFDNSSRRGFVFGSVDHGTWKTGIDLGPIHRRAVASLRVFAGAADKNTRDSQPHGFVSGNVIKSPRIMVGYYHDWRAGLEWYGRANGLVHPPLRWSLGVPFGWNSWAAYGSKIDQPHCLAVSEFLQQSLESRGFIGRNSVYVNLDSYWDNLTPKQLTDTVKQIHARGQLAGIYWAPFVYWGDRLETPVNSSEASPTYRNLCLKDDNGDPLPKLDGAFPLDPTNPETLKRVDAQLKNFVDWGFDYVKIDFTTHASLEGKHFDPKVTTGIEAYNVGMSRVVSDLSTAKARRIIFIGQAISPLFPSGYAHSRRISCDTWGKLSDSEYMLNSLTYGWWQQGGLYHFNDPDHTVLLDPSQSSSEEAQTRMNASVIAGTVLLDSDDLTATSARDRALHLLTNPLINELARRGEAFHPVDGGVGSASADIFERVDAGGISGHIAVFNFSKTASKSIVLDFKRFGFKSGATYVLTNLWSSETILVAGAATITIPPATSKVYAVMVQP